MQSSDYGEWQCKNLSGSLKNKNSESFGLSLFVFLIKMRGQQVAHPTPHRHCEP
ncbi:MAG: hypothetical protein IJ881_06355 [Neisseriaceae bacterium]|nr:hypothetical protein [Neisseriaceae bacterium]